jgi:uncharacterized membrane protein YgcG
MGLQGLKALEVQAFDLTSTSSQALNNTWVSPQYSVNAEPLVTTSSLAGFPIMSAPWFTPSGGDMLLRNRSQFWVTVTTTDGRTQSEYPIAPNQVCFLSSDTTGIVQITGGNLWDISLPGPSAVDVVTMEYMSSQSVVSQGTQFTTGTGTGTGTTGAGTGTGTGTGTSTGTGNPASGTTGGTGAGTGGTGSQTYYPIYVSGVQNGFRDYSYGSTFISDADTRVAGAIEEVASTGLPQYKGFNFNSLNAVPIAINNYLGVTIDAFVESGNPTVRLQLDSGDNGTPLVYIDVTLTNTWATYSFLFTDTGVINNSISTSSFTNFELINFNAATTGKVHINNVQLIVNPSPSTPTYSLVAIDSAPAVTTASSMALHTKGPHFYKADNSIWMGRGMNVCDTRMAGKAREVDGNTPTVTAQELKRRLGWAIDQGCDFFRMYLDQQSSALDMVNNPNYLASLKDVVNYIGSRGCYVMITCGVDYTCFPFLPTSGQPTVASLTHWSQIATSFRNSAHVLYGFCNEPQNNDTTATQAAYLAIVNQVIAVVRTVESRDAATYPHICVVQGPTHYARHGLFFNTPANRATDPTYPITDLVNTTGYLAYEVHNYESQANWGAVPYNEGLPGQGVAVPNFPFLLGEFGFNYYAQSDGSATVNATTDDMTPFFVACETYKVPYCIWILDFRDPPALIVDNDPYGYGLNKPIQWIDVGIKFINLLRSYKGLAGTVDLNGQPVTSGTIGVLANNGGTTSGNYPGGVPTAGSSGGGTGGGTGGGGTGGGGGGGSSYLWVYQNGLLNSFANNSYTGTYSTAADTRVTGGLAITALINQYGAVNFTVNTPLTASNYQGITVDMYAASGNPAVRVQIDTNSTASPIIYEIKNLTNVWTTFTFLWTDGSAVGSIGSATFTNVEIVNLASSTTPLIYVNNIGMIV